MSDLHAALGLTQLDLLDGLLASRRRLAESYTVALSSVPALTPPYEPAHCRHPWQSYQVQLTDECVLERDALIKALREDGIATRRGVMASHLEQPYRDAAPREREAHGYE